MYNTSCNSDSALTGFLAGRADNNGYNNGGMFGGAWEGIWGIIILAMVFGWGGFGGSFGGWGGGANGTAIQGALTRSDLCQEFSFNDLQNGVRNVNDSVNVGFSNMNSTICHQQYDTAMLVNGLGTNMMNGFHNMENAVCTLGYQTQAGFNAAAAQAADCCCKTQTNIMQLGNQMERGFCDNGYNMATNTTAIIQNAHNDTDRVLAKLDAMEMSRKDETIAELRAKLAACGDQNTAQYIINELSGVISPRAVPAYPAASPCGLGNWAPQVLANTYGYNGYSYGSNCGCGCGCNSGCGCN